MPLPKGTRFRAKRISRKKYVRLAYYKGKVIESRVKRYRKT